MKEITFWAAFSAIIIAVMLLVASFHLNSVLLFTLGTLCVTIALIFHTLFNTYVWKSKYEELRKKTHN